RAVHNQATHQTIRPCCDTVDKSYDSTTQRQDVMISGGLSRETIVKPRHISVFPGISQLSMPLLLRPGVETTASRWRHVRGLLHRLDGEIPDSNVMVFSSRRSRF